MSINDKIKQVLTTKNLSPSYLADDIGVQRSSISHILSGRNRPSLDIIQKIVRRFPEFSYEWFLEDDIQLSTSAMVNVPAKPTSSPATSQLIARSARQSPPAIVPPAEPESVVGNDKETIVPKQDPGSTAKSIERILVFYSDGTFREYSPA